MILRPPRSPRTSTLFPSATLFQSRTELQVDVMRVLVDGDDFSRRFEWAGPPGLVARLQFEVLRRESEGVDHRPLVLARLDLRAVLEPGQALRIFQQLGMRQVLPREDGPSGRLALAPVKLQKVDQELPPGRDRKQTRLNTSH